MRTIAAEDVTPALVALFDITKPTMPRAFNVLEGITRGQIVVEDAPEARWALVRDALYGTLYLGGAFDAPLLAALVEQFRTQGEVGIGCWRDDPLNDILPPNPDYDGATLMFTDRAAGAAPVPPLPAGYTLVERDAALLQQSFDYEATLTSFGSVEAAMRWTLGMAVLHDGAVVCEAGTGAPTHGMIEVGVTTAPEHRQRGLALAACAALIARCEARGYATWWDCAAQNIASARLARSMGYRQERVYRYVWWKG